MDATEMDAADSSPTPIPEPPYRNKVSGWWLLTAAGVSVVLWQVPFGNYLLYPFTILATWFHEMGHGVTALLLGGHFSKLLLFPDGSGMAAHGGVVWGGDWGRALVAAGGPLGPPLAGALFILAGRYYRSAHLMLIVLSATLLLSMIFWVRSPFGVVAIFLLGILIMLLAFKTTHWLQSFAIQFLGVQACVSSYQQVGYLFTRAAHINDRMMLSDTGQIAEYVGIGPYWIWGGITAALSLGILILSIRWAYR